MAITAALCAFPDAADEAGAYSHPVCALPGPARRHGESDRRPGSRAGAAPGESEGQ
jgi:hypothetical protein